VHTPGRSRTAWVLNDAVQVDPPGLPPAAELLATAALFDGLPYLWGGTSGLGLDCSGLVHLLFRRYGVTVPRDAHDQAAAGPGQIEPTRAAAGDLLFFARPGQEIHHVGICAGQGRMLHAPETGRGVALEPLSPQRQAHLVAARRW
ncbi:MAG: C40 family peptidase, partial [Actinomycetota bacterium]|nr:C40 family peptidase [Actinomycetota bacterium]